MRLTKDINMKGIFEVLEEIAKRQRFDDRDYMLLSKNVTYEKVRQLLDNNKKVVCDIHDRDGLIGLLIQDVTNNIAKDECKVIMRDMTILLNERFLYNIIYNVDKNRYSLQEQAEYMGKLLIRK
jgi:hypothetical protein